ncbi:glutathione S-transferase family protein [Pseudoxanthomonas sp.]|uniref:glutathione S-transferase family protein n=1 Tax=Pseudoxanthomonas sp. TaxID=1871049 RepID=UPI003F7E7275
MREPVTILGNYLSPYVRKVLVCLQLKGIAYRIDPFAPFIGDDAFSRLSPLRRIPVLIDGDFVLNDSTVICEYLEDLQPTPALYPAAPRDRARARWLEEFADSRLGEVIIWRMFYQLRVKRYLFGETPDEAVVRKAREEELPDALDYLETQLPAEGFLFGDVGVADVAIAAFFRNATFVRYRIDANRWPRAAAFVERMHALPAFAALAEFEDRTLRTPVAQQREVLIDMGAPVAATTFGNIAPRRGIMKVE